MYAVVVHDVYKKFGKPGDTFWKRMLQAVRSENGKVISTNGRNDLTGKQRVNLEEEESQP